MTFKTYEINVDLVHDTSTTCSNRFSQNDRNSAKLLVTITNKGAELDLSQAKSVRMSFKKPDGTRVFQNDCQPINAMKGKYQIVLKTQTLTSVGNVIAQIHIEEEDRIIDTQKFFFVVNDSLASDEAVESTNEFTIIQKAIEAGKKLEGVDINGTIAAGELAKGALPKTGGTMTGNIRIDKSPASGAGWRSISWDLENSEAIRMGLNGSNYFVLWDAPQNVIPFEYRPATKEVRLGSGATVNVLGDSNLVKKTGDTMTGNLEIQKGIPSVDLIVADGSKKVRLLYNAGNTTDYGFMISTPTGKAFLRKEGEATSREIATKEKDGKATLTLTANATPGSANPQIVTRRGNTVTVWLDAIRNADSTDPIITTLPEGMRPTDTINFTGVSTDGIPSRIMFRYNGEVHFADNTSKGKRFNIAFTYVAD
ncbi:BppU family phage baseplate upper protein [Bacillus paranthracis]|uniref:BppU family phage baseplate upper protein n=1 Tax=Bacillus paranthracis TaxID=2026186 RepID=UPI0007EED195|nr:BppU family phage baseplate upper protein [Bacillus paranthracis]MCC2436355.1 phage baseplate upper protein [Bacillus paranthracis]